MGQRISCFSLSFLLKRNPQTGAFSLGSTSCGLFIFLFLNAFVYLFIIYISRFNNKIHTLKVVSHDGNHAQNRVAAGVFSFETAKQADTQQSLPIPIYS